MYFSLKNLLILFFSIGFAFLFSVGAFPPSSSLSVLSQYQINGPYAVSGFVTDNNTIDYTIVYSGNSYVNYTGSYSAQLSDGACFTSISVTGDIRYYLANNTMTQVLDCNVRSIAVGLTGNSTMTAFDLSGNILLSEELGQSELVFQASGSAQVKWTTHLNNDGQGTFYHRVGSQSFFLYTWDGNQTHQVTQGGVALWAGGLNDNNRGNYQTINTGNGSNSLYVWNGTQSIPVEIDASSDVDWVDQLNNNNQGNYYIYNDNTSEYELYVWNGTGRIQIAQGYEIGWSAGLSDNGKSVYYIYNDNTSEYELYIWNGTQSILIANGADINWAAGLNSNDQGIYRKYNGNDYELYIWDGIQSILIDQGQNAAWGGILNNNNQGLYSIYNTGTSEYELYVWNGTQSILVDHGESMSWNDGINNNAQATYTKYDSNTSESSLYVRDGTQTVLVGYSSDVGWGGTLNDNNQNTYYIYNDTTNQNELYIWDGTTGVFVFEHPSAIWAGGINEQGQTNYIVNVFPRQVYVYTYNPSLYIQSFSLFTMDPNNYGWDKIFLNQLDGDGSYTYDIYDVVSNNCDTSIPILSGLVADGSGNIDISLLSSDDYPAFCIGTTYSGDLMVNDPVLDGVGVSYQNNPTYSGTVNFTIQMQSGISQNIIDLTGNYESFDLSVMVTGSSLDHSHTVYHPPVVPPQTPSNGGGGGGASSILADVCPNGDYSFSYYDGTCGNIPTVTGTAITYTNTDLYNTDIPDGYCYTRDTSSILDSKSISTSEEFKKALTFMYAYKMTMFRGVTQFEPYTNLTRQQAAKLFSNFATNVLCRKPDTSLKANYNDIADADPTLTHYINLAYELGLMKGGDNGNFRAFDTITKAEFNAVIVRMLLNSYLPENDGTHRYDTYNRVSSDLGIIKQGAGEVPVIRNDAALMLFRAYKNQNFGKNEESFVLESRNDFLPHI